MRSRFLLAILPLGGPLVKACPAHTRRAVAAPPRNTNGTSTFQVKVFPRPQRAQTALVNVRPLDGYQYSPATTIYFDGEYIVESADHVDHIIDGQGAVLLLGLIDSHCHPTTYNMLEDLTSWGVTTAISMGCNDYVACSGLHDTVGLASFVTAGQQAMGRNSAHALGQGTPDYLLLNSPSQSPQFVADNFESGAEFLKIISEENGPDLETQSALAAHTHALGRYATTHAASYDYYIMAVDAKTDGLQHIPFNYRLNSTTIEKMVVQKQWATPTMGFCYRFVGNPAALEILQGQSAADDTSFTQSYGNVQANVKALHAHGIPVLDGTDSYYGGEYPSWSLSA